MKKDTDGIKNNGLACLNVDIMKDGIIIDVNVKMDTLDIQMDNANIVQKAQQGEERNVIVLRVINGLIACGTVDLIVERMKFGTEEYAYVIMDMEDMEHIANLVLLIQLVLMINAFVKVVINGLQVNGNAISTVVKMKNGKEINASADMDMFR